MWMGLFMGIRGAMSLAMTSIENGPETPTNSSTLSFRESRTCSIGSYKMNMRLIIFWTYMATAAKWGLLCMGAKHMIKRNQDKLHGF